MDERYLHLGVRGMAVGGEEVMAHRGAAPLAAWFFDRDHRLAPDVSAAMTGQVDRQMKRHTWIFSDPPAGNVARCDPEELVEVLRPQLDTVNAIGHDIIFTALALRVFEVMPELCTEAVCDGLARLIRSCRDFPFTNVADVFDVAPAATGWADLDVSTCAAMARVAMETAVGFEHVYVGTHQGNIGHIINHAHALLTFERLGYDDVVDAGRNAFAMHAAGLQSVWEATADLDEAPPPDPFDADSVGYWERDLGWDDWASGHAFKYPYALFDLLPLVDESLATAAMTRVRALVQGRRETKDGIGEPDDHGARSEKLSC